jgi:saccharopine dehydrogenase (NAD+, L-lysine-forming)
MKIGIIKEYKLPADRRVALSPQQCKEIVEKHPSVQIIVEPSPDRIFSDKAYEEAGMKVSNEMAICDILIGIKEVPTDKLIENKTYFFFAHVIKEQAHNRRLMQNLIAKKIHMIDFETLTDEKGNRIIGFGKYAGIVGAFNGLKAWGLKTKQFTLPFAYQTPSYKALVGQTIQALHKITQPLKIVVTGRGRVGKGARQFLLDCMIPELQADAFLLESQTNCFCTLGSADLYRHINNLPFASQHFYSNPGEYESQFDPYFEKADIIMNGVFWREGIPQLITHSNLKKLPQHAMVIADISCDIAGSVAVTHRVSSINEPCYGINLTSFEETPPYLPDTLDIMAVPNLPTELPQDASIGFGNTFIQTILPELLKDESPLLDRASICKDGKLKAHFTYLNAFAMVD